MHTTNAYNAEQIKTWNFTKKIIHGHGKQNSPSTLRSFPKIRRQTRQSSANYSTMQFNSRGNWKPSKNEDYVVNNKGKFEHAIAILEKQFRKKIPFTILKERSSKNNHTRHIYVICMWRQKSLPNLNLKIFVQQIPPKTVLEDDVINKAAYMLDEEEILSKNCKNLSSQRMLHHQKKKVGEKRRVMMGIFNQKNNSEFGIKTVSGMWWYDTRRKNYRIAK